MKDFYTKRLGRLLAVVAHNSDAAVPTKKWSTATTYTGYGATAGPLCQRQGVRPGQNHLLYLHTEAHALAGGCLWGGGRDRGKPSPGHGLGAAADGAGEAHEGPLLLRGQDGGRGPPLAVMVARQARAVAAGPRGFSPRSPRQCRRPRQHGRAGGVGENGGDFC